MAYPIMSAHLLQCWKAFYFHVEYGEMFNVNKMIFKLHLPRVLHALLLLTSAIMFYHCIAQACVQWSRLQSLRHLTWHKSRSQFPLTWCTFIFTQLTLHCGVISKTKVIARKLNEATWCSASHCFLSSDFQVSQLANSHIVQQVSSCLRYGLHLMNYRYKSLPWIHRRGQA